jgi:hypothetical protein
MKIRGFDKMAFLDNLLKYIDGIFLKEVEYGEKIRKKHLDMAEKSVNTNFDSNPPNTLEGEVEYGKNTSNPLTTLKKEAQYGQKILEQEANFGKILHEYIGRRMRR